MKTMYDEERGDIIFKNYTPHVVNVYVSDVYERQSDAREAQPILSILPEGSPQVRVEERAMPQMSIGGVPVVKKSYGEIVGIPDPEENVVYIVSVLVVNALQGSRPDVVCPDTGPDSVVRDGNGRILGVRQFQQ